MKRKIQNWMFNNSIRIFQSLIEFIAGLISGKIVFEFNLEFNWNELKSKVELQF